MKFLLAFSGLVDRINILVGKSVSWLVLGAILVSSGNAIVRKLFNISSNAWLELQWYLFSAVFLLAAAYTLARNEHVKIDLVYGKLSRRTQVWIEIFGSLFFLLPFCVISGWLTWPVVVSKFTNGELSPNAGGLLLWPAWGLIPIAFVLLGFQGLSELVKRIAFLAGAADDPLKGLERHGH